MDFDFKSGYNAQKVWNSTGIQESNDPTMQSIGDIASYTSTGAAVAGPMGAVAGAGLGVIKTAINFADDRKARRAARKAAERKERRLNKLREQELAFRKKELTAEREGKRYSRQQDIATQRENSAQNMLNKLNDMLSNSKDLRQDFIERGYL